MIPLTRPPFTPTINGKYSQHRDVIFREIEPAIYNVLQSGILSKGEKVKEFETRVAKYVGTKYAVALNSCTSGLQLTLEALDIGHRDKVICPNFTYPSTRLAIENVEATPVFVDVIKDYCSYGYISDDWQIHAGIVVDLFGNMSFGDPQRINPCCASEYTKEISVIRDAACGLGINYKGRDLEDETLVFSFHPRKIITTGEGGMICTDDKQLTENLRSLAGYEHQVEKYNLRMSDVNAVMGLVQMEYLEDIIADRIRAAKIYDDLIDDHLQGKFVKHPRQQGVRQTFQSYVGMIDYKNDFNSRFYKTVDGDNIIPQMSKRDVEVQVGSYYVRYWMDRTSRDYHTINGYRFSRCCLALPMYYKITEAEQQQVITALKEVLK